MLLLVAAGCYLLHGRCSNIIIMGNTTGILDSPIVNHVR